MDSQNLNSDRTVDKVQKIVKSNVFEWNYSIVWYIWWRYNIKWESIGCRDDSIRFGEEEEWINESSSQPNVRKEEKRRWDEVQL